MREYVVSEALGFAIHDYRYLLDRGYPGASTLALVGNRYRLDARERMILMRGVLDAERSRANAAKRLGSLEPGASLCVDGYNVLFTLWNYMRGAPLFVATDGLLRDAGASHGRFSGTNGFERALELFAEWIGAFELGSLTVALDAPVSFSAMHAAALRDRLGELCLSVEVMVAASADPVVAAFDGDAIASSDSALVASSRAPAFDLARAVLERAFGARFPMLFEWTGYTGDGSP